MDAVSDAETHTVVVMSAAQVGKTEVINNIVGYHVHQDPAPMLLLQPTLEMGQAWSKDRLAPMLRDTPALQGLVQDARARDSGNTLLHKTFPGGHITIAGANSPASLSSRPIRVVLCDEVDRYPASAGTEGDPISLAAKRSATFWNRKRIYVSTPTIRGESRIEAAWEESDQRRFHVPCPHCHTHQVLQWSQVQWPDGHPEDAGYVCEHCGVIWTDSERWLAIRRGHWEAQSSNHGVAGFHLSELYSPWAGLGEIAQAFLQAKRGGTEQLKTWVNTSLGETWEDEGEQVDETGLLARREEYPAPVPDGACVLVAGVDVQDDRIEVEVMGAGEGEETWNVDHRVIPGDTSTAQPWDDLELLLGHRWRHESGAELHIAAMGVDSGHRTSEVYAFCRKHYQRRVFALKGMAGAGRPIVAAPKRTKTGPNAPPVPVYIVGVDEAKALVYSRLRQEEPGPGHCHFPAERGEEYFAQLTAEKQITKYRRGFPYREWVKTRPRNEALDLRVYALAALRILAPVYSSLYGQKQPSESKRVRRRQSSWWS